jgi:methionyl-tRNA formyltransferase
MHLAVIVDNPNSWFVPFARRLVGDLSGFGAARLLQSAAEIPEGNDVAFLLSCEKKLPPAVLSRSRHNIVVHASDLPRGKGMSPLTWQVLEGHNAIPISLFEAAEAIDAGNIYLKDQIQFRGVELLAEMHATLGEKIIELCLRFMCAYPEITSRGQAQAGEETFYSRRKPEDSRLDPHKTIAEQFNLLRVVDNERYPAFFEWRGKKFVVKITATD